MHGDKTESADTPNLDISTEVGTHDKDKTGSLNTAAIEIEAVNAGEFSVNGDCADRIDTSNRNNH